MMTDPSTNVEHGLVGTQTSGGNEALEWRRQQYLEMEFSEDEANALACSTQISYTGGKSKNEKKLEWTVPLGWDRVKKALDAGCDKETALDIFLSDDQRAWLEHKRLVAAEG